MLKMPVQLKQKIGKTTVEIARICEDGIPQTRGKINEAVAREYGAAMSKNGIMSFESIILFWDGSVLWLADGRHRILGAGLFGITNIHAEVREGTQRDAILYALGSNGDHGMRMTSADKRRAVKAMLMDEEWWGWSDNVIADHCHVVAKTVRTVRSEVARETGREIPTLRQGADKKTYHVPRRRCKVCGTLDDGSGHNHFTCATCGKVSSDAADYHLVEQRWLCKVCAVEARPSYGQPAPKPGKLVRVGPGQMLLPFIDDQVVVGSPGRT